MPPCRVLLADPPWQHKDTMPGPKRGAAKHYRTMPTADLCSLHIPVMDKDSLLFLWRVASMQEDAFRVARAWGFTVKAELVWVKTKTGTAETDEVPMEGEEPEIRMGMGSYARQSHEICLICSRGRGASLINAHDVRSVFYAPRTPKHSGKPEASYLAIERLIGDTSPRVELFARRPRDGWECIGDALGTTITFGLLGDKS